MTGTRQGELHTDRLVLRPYRTEDAPAILPLLGDFEVARWLARVPHPYRLADAKAFLAEAVAPDNGAEGFAITLEGRLIGGIGVHDLDFAPTLGYWLGRPHWRCGLMTEAVVAVLGHAFGPLGLEALYSGVFAGNIASMAIQKRFGFEIVGERMVHSVAHGKALRHIDTRRLAGKS